jgi:hypothetical protein
MCNNPDPYRDCIIGARSPSPPPLVTGCVKPIRAGRRRREEIVPGGGRPILRLLCLEGKALVELPMAFRSSRTHTIPAGSALTLVYGGDGVTASVEIRGRRAFVYTVTDGPPEVRRLGDSNRRLPKSAHTRGHGKANIEN